MSDGLGKLDLGKNVGPLPLGAWIVVVGGGLGIAYWRKKNAAAAAPADPSVDTSGVPGVGTGAVGGWVDTSADASSPAPSGPTTNEQWATLAINYLIAQNYDPNLADSAIRKYLLSQKLSVTEYALVRIALTQFGAPPMILGTPPDAPSTSGTPAPSTPAPSTPAPSYATNVPGGGKGYKQTGPNTWTLTNPNAAYPSGLDPYHAPAGQPAVGSTIWKDGQQWIITSYTFNGIPNLSAV